ncbi:MAG: RagB/SusD family nutrient uptake outer membrane protein [Bacteroidales bacterium]|nr:RagB/SusD family nutrient uptake outer membrane protein [Bacteroidales bacterium]
MKKYNLTILSLIAGILIIPASCSKDFLDTKPTDQVDATSVFQSVKSVWGAVNGLHRSMYIQYNSIQAHGGMDGLLRHIDFLGTDLLFNTGGNTHNLNVYKWIDHRNERSGAVLYWTNLYRLIGNANQILTKIDGITNVDNIADFENQKKHIKGQALAYRAWAHFMLVQLYAERYVPGGQNSQLGVPYMEEVTLEGKARNTVEEVYTKINLDLIAAIDNLQGYARANKSHINKSVAQAIQAQVALVQGNWELASTAANAARQGFSFMSFAQHQEGYSKISNPEFMWASYVQEDQSMYFFSFYAYLSHNFNSGVIRTSPKSIVKDLYDKISPTDVRKSFWHPNAVATGLPAVPPGGVRYNYMNSKFKAVSTSDSRGDFPWIRVAEMYLIEAEALARQTGKEEQAKDVLYLLAKNRDTQYTRSENSGQALIDEILIQRRIELWGEGRNFTDLKRLNLPLVRPEASVEGAGGHIGSIAIKLYEPAGSKNWTWMIPGAEIETNPHMVQNPA